MAAPVVAQVDGLGLADHGVARDIIPGVTEERSTRTFRRTFQHHINSYGTSSAETVMTRGNFRVFEQGWYHIPYTNPAATMTSADVDSTMGVCKNWEIIEQGFKIKRINVSQMAATTRPDGTLLQSSFVNNPQVMVWRDTDHDLFEDCFAGVNIDATSTPIWKLAGGPNTSGGINFLRPFLPSALLSGEGNSTLREVAFGMQTQGAAPIGAFDILNGGNVDLVGTGGGYEYTWKPTVRRLFTKNPTDLVNGIPGPMGDTTYMWKNAAAYEVKYPDLHTPMLHCIKVPPSWDNFGPILLNVELIIEYHFTIAFTRGRYMYSLVRNLAPPDPQNLGQVILDRNNWPQNVRRLVVDADTVNIVRGSKQKRTKLPNTYRPDLHGSTRARSSTVHASKQQ